MVDLSIVVLVYQRVRMEIRLLKHWSTRNNPHVDLGKLKNGHNRGLKIIFHISSSGDAMVGGNNG